MRPAVKKKILQFIFIINVLVLIALLVANAAPHVDPAKYWPVALLGMAFPLLLIAALLFIVLWLFIQRKRIWISVVVLLISLPNILITFAFNIHGKFKEAKSPNDVRIVTWNVGLMNYTAPDEVTAYDNNQVILQKIKASNADVVCLQEFFTCVVPGDTLNFIDKISRLGYTFHLFSYDTPKFDQKYYSGNIIFSKYKITDTLRKPFAPPFIGSVIKAAILVDNDTIDIVTSRLQSLRFGSGDYQALHDIKTGDEDALQGSKNIISKMNYAYRHKIAQIALVKNTISESRHPLVFTADMNDVPVSYAYATIRKGLSDAWAGKGFGVGRTFKYISPTLRIDQIFFNDSFKIDQVSKITTESASDHEAVLADLHLIKKGD